MAAPPAAVRRELGAAPPRLRAPGKDGVAGGAAARAGPGAPLPSPHAAAARGAEPGHQLAGAVR